MFQALIKTFVTLIPTPRRQTGSKAGIPIPIQRQWVNLFHHLDR